MPAAVHGHRSAGREVKALGRLSATSTETDDEAPSSVDALVSEERRVEVRRALAALDEEDRELLREAFEEELETSEIARRHNLTANAVRVRKHRALKRLAARLEPPGGGNDPSGSAT